MKKNQFFSNLKLYSDVYKAGSMISLSNEKHLMLVLKEVGWRIVTAALLSTKETNRFRMMHNFGVHLLKLKKNHGEVYVVKYLKACQLAIQKKLAGQPLKSLREVEPDYNFPRLSKSGLPSVIKLTDRSAICNNSYRVVRLWSSIFSIYRAIRVPFTPKLNTITDSFSGSQYHLDDFNLWLSSKSLHWLTKFSKLELKDLKQHRVIPIVKSCPQGPRSYTHLIGSYIGLKDNKIVWKAIWDYIELTKSTNIARLLGNLDYFITKFNIKPKVSNFPIGKLAFKEEAAGKLRVFAMVDVITQSLLEPLHLQLFELFKRLPNDCTHDQDKGVAYARDLSLKYNCSYGFDLSAATDRLPLSSQVAILNSIFGSQFGDLWGKILVDRDYIIAPNDYELPEGNIRYAVGQPMGALSSWAMLNLMHHLMIQFIAYHQGKTQFGEWYKDYIVLGDDLALFDKEVADRYLSLCKQLGVSINLSKSIIAENKPVLEFAKRTSINGVDVSALPVKELLSGNNFFGRLAISMRLIKNSWGSDPMEILRIVNKKKNSKKVDLIYPMVGVLTQAYLKGETKLRSVLALITNKDYPLSFFGRNINWMKPGLIRKVVKEYFERGVVNPTKLPVREQFFAEQNSVTFKVVCLHKIKNLVEQIKKMSIVEERVNILKTILTEEDIERLGKKTLIELSPAMDVFYVKPGQTAVSLRALRMGFDIDLTLGIGFTFVTMKSEISYLKAWDFHKDEYFNTKKFFDLELQTLLDDLKALQAWLKSSRFYIVDENLNKEVIDNPLKVLDFIKEIHNPKYKVKSEWLKFKGNIIEFDANVDASPGFKPNLDFLKKGSKPAFTVDLDFKPSFSFGKKK